MGFLLFYYVFVFAFSAGGLIREVKENEMDVWVYLILIFIFPIMFPFILGEYVAEKTNFF